MGDDASRVGGIFQQPRPAGNDVFITKLLLSGKSLKPIVMLLPLQGATAPTHDTQGVASLALGYGLHWAFSPPLLKS